MYSCLFTLRKRSGKGIPLTRGSGPLKSSDSAPILQYGSGPSADFMAKILRGRHSTVSFQHSVFTVRNAYKSMRTCVVSDSSVGSVFTYGAGGWVSFPSVAIVLITMSIMALEAVKFHFFTLCIDFFS
jgi:hypothetical protein